jgi:hypothetical protein
VRYRRQSCEGRHCRSSNELTSAAVVVWREPCSDCGWCETATVCHFQAEHRVPLPVVTSVAASARFASRVPRHWGSDGVDASQRKTNLRVSASEVETLGHLGANDGDRCEAEARAHEWVFVCRSRAVCADRPSLRRNATCRRHDELVAYSTHGSRSPTEALQSARDRAPVVVTSPARRGVG